MKEILLHVIQIAGMLGLFSLVMQLIRRVIAHCAACMAALSA